MGTNNAIILAGEYRRITSKVAAAAGTKPGHLLEENSAGKLAVHSTSGGYAERMVACEDALQGKTLSDTYTAANIVDAAIMSPGSESQVFLASGQSVSIGDVLMSAGDGTLTARTSTNIGLCVATEALDLSASGAVDTLLNVRWL